MRFIIMTSEQRHEARYKRRKSKRTEKRKAFLDQHNDFSKLIDIDNLYKAYHKCTLGVNWKSSTQRYSSKWMENLIEARRKLMYGEDVRTGFVHFMLHERGKTRRISSVHISERVIQKCLCDQVLTPVLSRFLIYDNSASTVNRGTSFALRRLQVHMLKYYRRHGVDGYALMIDYSGFFDSIRHDILLYKIHQYIKDEKVFNLIKGFITAFGPEKSLGLGSQVSQICALFYPSREIDLFIKQKLMIKFCGRYMDDLYLIHHSKEYLKYCLKMIARNSEHLGLKVNLTKTRIVTLRHGLIFLKGRYSLTASGRIIKRPCRGSTVRMRKRLKRFRHLLDIKKMSRWDVYSSYESWRGTYRRRFHAYYRVGKMDALYNQLFLYDRE